MKDALRDWRVWVLFLSLQIPSLRALFKYVPGNIWPIIPLYLVGTWLLYADLLHEGFVRRILVRSFFRTGTAIVLLVLIIAVNLWLYPIADALKLQGRGSDQDDALIEAGKSLIRGENPFETVSYYNQNPSAGPGWVIMALPFSVTGLYAFLSPALIGFTTYFLLRRTRGADSSILFLLLLMSSIGFWEIMITGSDFLALGCLLLLSIAAVYEGWNKSTATKVLSAVFLAFVSSARVAFSHVIILASALVFHRHRKQGALLLSISGGVLLVLHLCFYLWNPSGYSPLKTTPKGLLLMGPAISVVAIVCSAATLLWAVLKRAVELDEWLFRLWLVLVVPLAFVSLGDFHMSGSLFGEWEGANYLGVVMPIFVAWIALRERNLQLEIAERNLDRRESL